MKRLLRMLDISILALLITNLWVLIFSQLLDFLMRSFPPATPPNDFFVLDSVLPLVIPEPHEAPLYIVITALFVVALWLALRKQIDVHVLDKVRSCHPKVVLFLKGLFFLFLLKIFISSLGRYPLAHDFYPYASAASLSATTQTFMLYLSVIIFLILQLHLAFQYLRKKHRGFILFLTLVSAAVAFLTFEPRFPMIGLDYSFFFGPVWEVLSGKTIYTSFPSQYGFGSILSLSLFAKLHTTALWYLPALVWILYVVQYTIIFYVVYKVSNSVIFSLIALFSVITVNYYSLFHLPASVPQIGPLRWLPLVLSLLLLVRLKNLHSIPFTITLASFSLWSPEIGIVLILSYVASVILTSRARIEHIRSLFSSIFIFCISLVAVMFVISIVHLALGFQRIEFISSLKSIQLYGKIGAFMSPLPKNTYFWTVLLVYFASIIVYLKGMYPKKYEHFLVFTSHILFFASMYYVGRSVEHNLFHVGLFFVPSVFILLGPFYSQLRARRSELAVIVTLFALFILYPSYQRKETMTELFKVKIQKFHAGNIFLPEVKEQLETIYKKDIPLINRLIKDKETVILSLDNTYLYYLTGKQSLIDANHYALIATKEDMYKALKRVKTTCPKRIAGDCKLFKVCSFNTTFSTDYLDLLPTLRTQIEEGCNITYVPLECADNLCVAQAKANINPNESLPNSE